MEEGLPYTTRASFGFANTNFTSIGDEKKRLNPGLEDAKVMKRYGAFFEAVQKEVDGVMKSKKKSVKHLDDPASAGIVDAKLAEKLEGLKVKKPKA